MLVEWSGLDVLLLETTFPSLLFLCLLLIGVLWSHMKALITLILRRHCTRIRSTFSFVTI